MPRTKFDPNNGKYRELGVLINGAAAVDGKNWAVVGGVMGYTDWATIRKYLQHPEKLSLETLSRLGRNLGIPIDQLRLAAIRY
jgi:hypothetical protein